MRTLGICFGATTLQNVLLYNDADVTRVESSHRILHEGDPKKTFLNFLNTLDLTTIDKLAVTGRSFRKNVQLSSIAEAVALEHAIQKEYVASDFPDFVISSGGETQLAYKISPNGHIIAVYSGNKCASGTGEFFLQQIKRMNLTLEEAIKLSSHGTPHKIAGRCSVFCKSDCTHALNKGEPRPNIVAGLCHMMADRMLELVKDKECEKITFIGGGSLNPTLIQILSNRLPSVEVPKLSATFEAYGAALWALENECIKVPDNLQQIVNKTTYSFGFHEPLHKSTSLIHFKESSRIKLVEGDICILGLDVGSTTTKAVLLHKEKQKIAASVYGRTNGNPIEASKMCYKAIREQIGDVPIKIVGLGVTGSGRQIAALHALSRFVINEIIAHATAAAFFDPDVDTIFEIGGQDAKYTYLTGGVPSDYAMNEACSAGTGSFIEESSKESLNIPTEEIGDLALQGQTPPNFTDQCAAFISSDIKRAGQEGISKNDILAGLVYSICLNYINRVKGARPVDKKIFMQGGVCYNKAVPVAMASLLKTPIVVPPDPGLMGAFGVALEVKKQLELGLMSPENVNLDELITRKAETVGHFVCAGGKERCDRKCEIAKIKINDKMYPFGGACDRYYNLRLHHEVNPGEFNYVAIRQRLLFRDYFPSNAQYHAEKRKTVGIMRSFLTHSLAVLYTHFFHQLGFEIVLADRIDPAGIARIESSFCLPAEISHGSFLHLIKKDLDYIFLPHIKEIPISKPDAKIHSKTCVFVQGEPYYLKTTFRKEINQVHTQILSPILNMNQGYEQARDLFMNMALEMGVSKKLAEKAFDEASQKQYQFEQELLDYGKKALAYLDAHPQTFGIVLLGRPYNAFADDVNMGIPHKIASRGIMTIPFDMLPLKNYQCDEKVYWAMGQKILQTAQMIKEKENLFGFYITNFSCGPDSFVLGYFRHDMGTKPSLTIELDQHTADAGIDTRIEAALSIMKAYRTVFNSTSKVTSAPYKPVRVVYGKEPYVITADNTQYSLRDPQVEVWLPPLGRLGTEAISAIFRRFGIQARALPVPDKDVLLEGKKNTLCKECLPYILTTGSFLSALKTKPNNNKIILFLMATGKGPCRLGQYAKALENVIEKHQLSNVAVLTISDENGYAGLGNKILLRSWQVMVIAEVLDQIKSMLAVTAQNKDAALAEYEALWQNLLLPYFAGTSTYSLTKTLTTVNKRLVQIPLRKDPRTVPVISLVGEIYVRNEEFSRKNIIDYLEERGFMVKVAPVSEYICYSNYIMNHKINGTQFSFLERIKIKIITQIQKWWEKYIKSILAKSGLYRYEMIDVAKTIQTAHHLIHKRLEGEGILTVGLALREILHTSCGVICIGPFGCMPSRVAEAILRKEMNVAGKQRIRGEEQVALQYKDMDTFPCLFLETDGNPFPQMVEANLEAFVLQAKRLHEKMTSK